MKPCPFCPDGGDLSVIEVDVDIHAVCCQKCGATGPIENYDHARQSQERGVELWNQRGII